jgi:Na+/melibiose symporter-like transporter
VLPAFLVAGVALAAFVAWERRSDHPMLPLNLFRDRRFSTGSGVVIVAFFLIFGFFFLLTQYFQFARGYSPLEAGLAGLPPALTLVALSPRSAALAQRYGAARVMAAGLVVTAGGLGVLITLSPDTPYVVIAGALALLGAGVAITVAPATGYIMTSVPQSKAGVGSAVNDTTRELGGALGIALLGSIANTAYRSNIDLTGVRLPAGARAAAQESIGAADAIAGRIPGGEALATQAASAFTDAFKLATSISVGIALAAAATILVVWRRRREPAVDEVEDVEPEAAETSLDLARVPVRRWCRPPT